MNLVIWALLHSTNSKLCMVYLTVPFPVTLNDF